MPITPRLQRCPSPFLLSFSSAYAAQRQDDAQLSAIWGLLWLPAVREARDDVRSGY